MQRNTELFAQRLDAFMDSHRRQYFPEERLEVMDLYKELVSLLEGEANFAMEDRKTSMKLTITAPTFLSSKDFPALQDLIHAAATFKASIQDSQIVLSLYFTFWKWVTREITE